MEGTTEPRTIRAALCLGEACEANVVVRWPDAGGTREAFSVPAGQLWLSRVKLFLVRNAMKQCFMGVGIDWPVHGWKGEWRFA